MRDVADPMIGLPKLMMLSVRTGATKAVVEVRAVAAITAVEVINCAVWVDKSAA